LEVVGLDLPLLLPNLGLMPGTELPLRPLVVTAFWGLVALPLCALLGLGLLAGADQARRLALPAGAVLLGLRTLALVSDALDGRNALPLLADHGSGILLPLCLALAGALRRQGTEEPGWKGAVALVAGLAAVVGSAGRGAMAALPVGEEESRVDRVLTLAAESQAEPAEAEEPPPPAPEPSKQLQRRIDRSLKRLSRGVDDQEELGDLGQGRAAEVTAGSGSAESAQAPGSGAPSSNAPSSSAPSTNKSSTSKSCHADNPHVEQTAPGTYSVDEELTRRYSDPDAASGLVRGAWHKDKSGNRDGVVVRGIPCSSPLHEMGLRKGDVVQSVNGVELTSTAKAMAAYQSVKSRKSASVSLLRKGKRVGLRYNFE
jgi:hypothetical protein